MMDGISTRGLGVLMMAVLLEQVLSPVDAFALTSVIPKPANVVLLSSRLQKNARERVPHQAASLSKAGSKMQDLSTRPLSVERVDSSLGDSSPSSFKKVTCARNLEFYFTYIHIS